MKNEIKLAAEDFSVPMGAQPSSDDFLEQQRRETLGRIARGKTALIRPPPRLEPARLLCLPDDLLSLASRSDICAELVAHFPERALADLILDYGGCFLVHVRESDDGLNIERFPVRHWTYAPSLWEGPQATLLVPCVFEQNEEFRHPNRLQVVLWHQQRETTLTFSRGTEGATVRYVRVSVPDQTPFDALEVRVKFFSDKELEEHKKLVQD